MVTARSGISILQFVLFTIFLFCLSLVSVSTQVNTITCSIPSVKPFQGTVLTCHFPEDLSVTKKDFTVYHYVDQGNPEAVLDCWWVGGSQECYSKPGFTFDKKLNRSLNLTVDRVVDKHVGKYACQIVGYGSTFLETCEFLLKLDAYNTCNFSKANNDSLISLTCFFNEDVGKTQHDFTVYKHDEQEKLTVLDCWWENGNQRCRGETGYLYDEKVSTYFNMAIPTTTKEKTYMYSCWHGGYHGDQVKTCSFVIDSNGVEAEKKKGVDTVALGASLGILALIATATAGIVLFMRRRRRNMSSSVAKEEEFPMVSSENQLATVTEEFQGFLLNEVKDMYPNMPNECYFVPPVYFNKTRYSITSVIDQVFYVPDPPNLKDISHDRAMQHVMHCLRQMAEQNREQMFVLTQFSYDDYLRCPSPEYIDHRLPVPGGLKVVTSDQDVGCFDVLIIHRHHGVVVGVVKTISDKDNGSEDDERRTDKLLISEVSQGLRQLQRADCIIQHFVSDQRPVPVVRRILMLPNVSLSTIRRALGRPGKGKEDETLDDAFQLCLCANHLSNPCAPWDVDHSVMIHFKKRWDQLMSSAVDGPAMTDGVYQNMIARFCGPATVSSFKISDESTLSQLPKTLHQAVSLIGDLFERFILSMDITNFFEEPRVCLAGPPGTGKKKMLALVGRKWISEGRVVYLINTNPESKDSIIQLHEFLVQNSATQSTSIPATGSVKRAFCNIKNKKAIDAVIKSLTIDAKGRPLFALADEPDCDENKLKQLKTFLQKLNERLRDLHLWVAISRADMAPPGWKGTFLGVPLSCPPSVTREAWKDTDEDLYSTANNLSPTDGLPVKHFYHRGQGHTGKEPRDCYFCGQEIVRFFTRDLHVVNQDVQNVQGDTTSKSHRIAYKQFARVQSKDILLLFERDINEDSSMIKPLKESGIPVQVLDSSNKPEVVKCCSEAVLAAKASLFSGFKRKVVVYVEGNVNRSDYSLKWSRLRSMTSCTSQLVVVHI